MRIRLSGPRTTWRYVCFSWRWTVAFTDDLQPERIQGLSYTITSDVWSLGVTLLEVAQHRFPFGQSDESGGHARAGLIDLLTYIVRQPIPELKDEPELGIKWSDNFKYFISCW
jgi:mitogen-activated protein kinase kinase